MKNMRKAVVNIIPNEQPLLQTRYQPIMSKYLEKMTRILLKITKLMLNPIMKASFGM